MKLSSLIQLLEGYQSSLAARGVDPDVIVNDPHLGTESIQDVDYLPAMNGNDALIRIRVDYEPG